MNKLSDAGIRKKNKATRSHPKFSNTSYLKHMISVVPGLAKGYKMSHKTIYFLMGSCYLSPTPKYGRWSYKNPAEWQCSLLYF